jgi:Nickel responsive protein SCO4226-like
VPSFLVEAYTPVESGLTEVECAASRAAGELSREGTPVRYLRAIFVPADQTCFYLFEAPTAEVAGEASRRASIEYERIVETCEVR